MEPSTFIATENGIEDIQYLMHLEAIKRFTDDNKNVQGNVEEQARNWQDAKCEYQSHYSRLVRISKCCLLANAAATQKSVATDQVARMANDVRTLASKISSDKQATILNQNAMEQSTINLKTGHRARSLLSKQQRNCADNQETLKSVHESVELVENRLEATTVLALDNLIRELPPRESSKNVDSS
ncbi:augmin complex subunit dgt4 [Drosophila obscura]|uniref:augmin complex subunit dgt4 n=1 Tax=Drosophila obscura TaxID=7282 RepID=UPI001BB24FD6|nr:augmin complex subunit dgt4 [Drosophila obscura]